MKQFYSLSSVDFIAIGNVDGKIKFLKIFSMLITVKKYSFTLFVKNSQVNTINKTDFPLSHLKKCKKIIV